MLLQTYDLRNDDNRPYFKLSDLQKKLFIRAPYDLKKAHVNSGAIFAQIFREF